jgi:hypothetical protein
MGLAVTALLALSAAEPTLAAQAVHYGQLGEGWARSRFLRRGMTFNDVRRIMGRADGSVGGFSWDLFYRRLGVMITINFANDIEGEVVGVYWHPELMRRRRDGLYYFGLIPAKPGQRGLRRQGLSESGEFGSDREARGGAIHPLQEQLHPGAEPGTLWERLFGFFQFNRADFLARYHAKSNVESTFSMVKAKFRDHVRSKTDTAMKNEVLLKLLCHNVVVVHQAIIELGIEGTFWPEKAGERKDALPMMRHS